MPTTAAGRRRAADVETAASTAARAPVAAALSAAPGEEDAPAALPDAHEHTALLASEPGRSDGATRRPSALEHGGLSARAGSGAQADTDAGADAHAGTATPPLVLTGWELVRLNSFWFSYQFFFFLVAIVLTPSQITAILGDAHKGQGLGTLSAVSGLFNLLIAVVFGAWNDRFASRYGRRMPFILGGSVGMVLFLTTLWDTDPFWFYVLGFVGLTVSTVFASVAFNGLIADVASPEQKGFISAVMSAMNLTGYLMAALLGTVSHTLSTATMYMIMTAVLAVGTALTLTALPARVVAQRERMGYQARGWSVEPIVWKPFLAGLVASLVHHRDFRLVFLSRFFFQMGIATVQGFLQYFVSDCLVTDLPPTVAVSVVMLPLLVLSPISAALAPRDAPRRVVYAAAAVMVWACLCLASLRSFLAVMAVCGVFGIAYGPFMSVEFAMVIAVLPDPKTAARDISLWHTALVLPQIMASPIAGMLRDALQPVGNDLGVVCLGYKVVYVVCIGYLLLGVLATRLIRSID